MSPVSTCRDGTARLMEYTDGALDESLRRAIDEHVAGCARCQAFVRSYASVAVTLRQATHADLSPAGQEALRRALASRRH